MVAYMSVYKLKAIHTNVSYETPEDKNAVMHIPTHAHTHTHIRRMSTASGTSHKTQIVSPYMPIGKNLITALL